MNVGHAVRSIAHLAVGVPFYLELLREVTHRRIMSLWGTDAISGTGALRGSRTVLKKLQMPKVRGQLVCSWAWLWFVIIVLSVGVLLDPYRSCVLICWEDITHVAAIVARVINSRARNLFFVSIFVYKSVLAWTPIGGSWVCNRGNAILSVLIDLYSLPVGSWTWNIVLDICVDWFYKIV